MRLDHQTRKLSTLIIIDKLHRDASNFECKYPDWLTATELSHFLWVTPQYALTLLKDLVEDGMVDSKTRELNNGVEVNLFQLNELGSGYIDAMLHGYNDAIDSLIKFKKSQVRLMTCRK